MAKLHSTQLGHKCCLHLCIVHEWKPKWLTKSNLYEQGILCKQTANSSTMLFQPVSPMWLPIFKEIALSIQQSIAFGMEVSFLCLFGLLCHWGCFRNLIFSSPQKLLTSIHNLHVLQNGEPGPTNFNKFDFHVHLFLI